MKKKINIFLILVVVVYSNSVIAQSPQSTNYNFCALNGTCYNDSNHGNVLLINDEYSPEQIELITNAFITNYPDFTVLAPASLLYNCHGYAYSVFQGGEQLEITWKDTLCISNGVYIASYIQVLESEVRPGDIVTAVDNTGAVLYSPHSSIVLNEDTLISKFAGLPLFKHYKYDPWIVEAISLGIASHYVYYRRVINNTITGPSVFNGTGSYVFVPDVTPSSCTWSVEPAAMFQTSSGTGYTANLSYATPFTYLAPKAKLTFTFSYGCDNHYTATKEIDLRIPTTTISGIAVSDGFIVDTNAVVTVTGEIRNNKKARTIVPVGTKLIIDGGEMINNGTAMWRGIEVWGNSNVHQGIVNDGYLQGYLEMKNGATIENAVCAIELCNPAQPNTSGGIVHATDAVFRNNAKAVHTSNYTNHDPSYITERPYDGWFKNCSFVIDSDYLGTETFDMHVDMAHVNGISFEGCHFSADRSVTGVSDGCSGLAAYSAGFKVTQYCDNNGQWYPCPTNDVVRSTFTGFNNGVLSLTDGSDAYSFIVNSTDFTDNTCGIFAQNTGRAYIDNNEFEIGGNNDCGYGIYADGVTGFDIEENVFRPVTGTSCTTYGIGISNSSSINDIYLNTFENLTCGNMAYGVNHTGYGRVIVGLTYSCNDNTGNDIDFCVMKDGGSGGIQSVQGSSSVPAGNTFGGTTYHFYNNGDFPVDYYYNPNVYGQTPTLQDGVTLRSTTNTNSCRPHNGGGGSVKSPEEKKALAKEFDDADREYRLLEAQYDSQVAAGIVPEPELTSQMTELVHRRDMVAGDIVRSDLNDTVTDIYELRLWLGKLNDIAADRMIVASYLQEGDFTSALALANTLPDTYELKGDALSDHDDYMKLLELYQCLYKSGRTVLEMTDEEAETVKDIADNRPGTSQRMAKAIMMRLSDRYMEVPCLTLPGQQRKGLTTKTTKDKTEDNPIIVNVAPIPASTRVSIDYRLPAKSTHTTMTLFDATGNKMTEIKLDGEKGVKTVDIRSIPVGVYTYIITCGEYVKNGKLVITR